LRKPSIVTGLGVDLDGPSAALRSEVRERLGLGNGDILVCIGRLDPGKGTDELFDFFTAFKERHPGPLSLVCAGPTHGYESPSADIVLTGVVDEPTKRSLIAGSIALIQPSYFESFSLVLAEAWAEAIPALVNGRCAVLDGQARRSGGAIPYRGYAEFEAGLEWLMEDPPLRATLGQAGRSYAERSFRWDAIMDRYERFLDWIAHRAPR
jgi:glycosyltransferase involved in cell wall biosynthesis